MKRSGLKRGGTPLNRDPSKGLKRTELQRGDKPLKRGDKPLSANRDKQQEFSRRAKENSKRRAPLSDAIRERVLIRCDYRCVMCAATSWLDPHHILPVRNWPELEEEEFNLIMLCRGCHDAHERHSVKVPTARLPIQLNRFLFNHPDREEYMRRHYA